MAKHKSVYFSTKKQQTWKWKKHFFRWVTLLLSRTLWGSQIFSCGNLRDKNCALLSWSKCIENLQLIQVYFHCNLDENEKALYWFFWRWSNYSQLTVQAFIQANYCSKSALHKVFCTCSRCKKEKELSDCVDCYMQRFISWKPHFIFAVDVLESNLHMCSNFICYSCIVPGTANSRFQSKHSKHLFAPI